MSVRRLDPVQPDSFAFTADNLDWARRTIAKYPAGKQASAVIPLLWRAQEQNRGWVSRPAIECVAAMLEMSYIRVLEVATFYTMFQLSPVGRKAHIQVCGTTPCMLRGAADLRKVCERRIHPEPHHVSADGDFSWEEAECLGACVNAPMVQIFKDTYEDLTPARLEEIIDALAAGRAVKPGPQIARQFSAPAGGLTTLIDGQASAEPPAAAGGADPSGEPELLTAPRADKGDDLKLIRGVGPKLEKLLNAMGVWHFDQIAAWTEKELAWVDERLEGFRGRAGRDEWVKQARKLATGGRPNDTSSNRPK